MRIAVFGTGGVGGYFGGRLAQAGENIIFIARGAHLKAMHAIGLHVGSIKGDFIIDPISATDEPAQAGYVDIVLVAVKTWQVPEAARAMQPMIGPDTFVVPLCNGIDALHELVRTIGKERVLGGFCRISAYVSSPGHIMHVGVEPYIAFGELDGSSSERAGQLRRVFECAGITVEVLGNIQAAMWQKFIFIAAISGLGAVTRTPIGVLRDIPETRRMLEEAIQENFTVGKAMGINLPDDTPKNIMQFIDRIPEHVTASMQRDIIEGRQSELESLNGSLVRFGREVGISTPINEFIYSSLLPQELSARRTL
jgi:2-dehydropantoate 2-reductase